MSQVLLLEIQCANKYVNECSCLAGCQNFSTNKLIEDAKVIHKVKELVDFLKVSATLVVKVSTKFLQSKHQELKIFRKKEIVKLGIVVPFQIQHAVISIKKEKVSNYMISALKVITIVRNK